MRETPAAALRCFYSQRPPSGPQTKAAELELTLELLAEDAFHPQLKTHKLKGKLAASWACSAGYDLRVIFQFAKHKGADAIQIEGVGTHDEVY